MAADPNASQHDLLGAVQEALEDGGDTVAAIQAITTKLSADPATETKQDTVIAGLASILAKLIAAPATAANQATGNASLASILAKIIAAPATEAKQDTLIDEAGALKRVPLKSGTVANYDGTEIEITGLTASAPHRLLGLAYRLTGGTAGNTTTPSFGEVSGFTPGDANTRRTSAALVRNADVTLEVFAQPIPFWSDADGKAFIKGASPGVADSSLFWRADIAEDRSA